MNMYKQFGKQWSNICLAYFINKSKCTQIMTVSFGKFTYKKILLLH